MAKKSVRKRFVKKKQSRKVKSVKSIDGELPTVCNQRALRSHPMRRVTCLLTFSHGLVMFAG